LQNQVPQYQPEKNFSRALGIPLLGLLIFIGLFAVSMENFLLFHAIVETFSIVVAFAVFVITWNTRVELENNYLMVVGSAFLFIGALDFLHTLAYSGMGVFPGAETNLATQLWIAARYLQAAAFLIAPFALGTRFRTEHATALFSIAAFFLLSSILWWEVFPLCFVEGQGLTPFKKLSEYAISLVLLISIVMLFFKRHVFDRSVFLFLSGSMALTVVSEMLFTLYASPFGFSNLLGHFTKLMAFYLVYRAIIVTGLIRPHDILVRELKLRENDLTDSESRYRMISDMTSDYMFRMVLDKNGALRVDWMSEKFKDVTGYDPSEIDDLGKYREMLLHPEDMEVMKARTEEVLSGSPASFEFRIRAKDGQMKWVRTFERPYFDTRTGEIIGIIGASSDISRQRRAELDSLRRAEVDASLAKVSAAVLESDSLDEISYLVLETALSLTKSEAGFVGYIDPETGFMVSPTLTRTVWDRCGVPGKDIVFKEWSGLWGWVIDNKTELMTNEPSSDPRSTGVPEGHIPIENFLSVPAMRGDELMGQVAVCNTDDGYSDDYLNSIRRLADLYSIAVGRYRIQDELKRSEERYRSVTEMTSDYIYRIRVGDEGGLSIDYITGKFQEITGYSEDELEVDIENTVLKACHPEDIETLKELNQQNLSGEEGGTSIRLRTRDGRLKWVYMRQSPVYDEKGRVEAIIGAGRDITEFRNIQEERERNRKFVTEVMNKAPALVCVTDVEGRIVAFNRTCEEVIGYGSEEVIGKTLQEILPEGREREFVGQELGLIKDGKVITNTTQNWPTREGNERIIQWSNSAMYGPDGEIANVVGVGVDVTDSVLAREELEKHQVMLEQLVDARTEEIKFVNSELKAEVEEKRITEAVLRETNEMLEGVFSSTHLQIAHLDRDMRYVRVNRAYAESASETVDFFHGKNRFELYPDPVMEELFREVIESGDSVHKESYRVSDTDRTGERESWWDWTAHPLKNSEGEVEGLTLVIIDVTDEMVARREEQEASRQLEEERAKALRSDRLRSLGEMAAAMAHELNQPLLGVRGLAEHIKIGLARGWEMSDEEISQKTELIMQQADRMVHVIQHTRDFARGGEAAGEIMPVDVNEVLQSCLSMIGAQLNARGVEVDLQLGEILTISANPFSMEEVMMNLINNARDAICDSDGLTENKIMSVTTNIDNMDGLEYVKITVADRGPGIPPDVLERVFDPFFTTKDPGSGTGLGLPICKSIVEGFGGTINIKSSEGKGTEVAVVFPANTG